MLDIVIPVYNEGSGILKLFDEIQWEIKTPKRLLVVYDFDEDTTIPVVRENKEKYLFDIMLIKNNIGRGALNAIRTGMKTAESEMILVVMADSSDKLDVVDDMCQRIQEGYDLVCGSRYMKGGRQNGGSFLKKLFSRTAGRSLHFLTSIPTHDVTNSFKLYRQEMLNNIDVESTGGFEIGMEIAVKAYAFGYKVTEVPSEWFDREEGESNFHMWKWMPHYLHWYFWCIIHSRFINRKRGREGSRKHDRTI